MDMFDRRGVKPMLLYKEKEPFDSPNYIFELKLDGSRCVAYIEPGMVDLRNKRGVAQLPQFPELGEIWRQVKGRCILDGELVVLVDGKPDFERLISREMTTNAMRIELAARRYPASFVAFDIRYHDGEGLTARPLMERKGILSETVTDGARLAVSRYLEEGGPMLFRLTQAQGLDS